tara:strand:+ start:683 stop:1225 length:543 start_codon:yes stop_codon:yes gene_type:complete
MKKIISIFVLFVLFSFCSSGPEASIDIFEAAKMGNIDEINLHIQGGSDLNERGVINSDTPLIFAAIYGQNEIVKLLSQQESVNLDSQNIQGLTALCVATVWGQIDIIETLLAAGADKNIKCFGDENNNGPKTATALMAAQASVNPGIEKQYTDIAEQYGLEFDLDAIIEGRAKAAEALQK